MHLIAFVYNHLYLIYRPVLLRYGIWDQIRVDQGKEWILMLFVQEQLAHFRRNTGRNPHIQTSSKQVANTCSYSIIPSLYGYI